MVAAYLFRTRLILTCSSLLQMTPVISCRTYCLSSCIALYILEKKLYWSVIWSRGCWNWYNATVNCHGNFIVDLQSHILSEFGEWYRKVTIQREKRRRHNPRLTFNCMHFVQITTQKMYVLEVRLRSEVICWYTWNCAVADGRHTLCWRTCVLPCSKMCHHMWLYFVSRNNLGGQQDFTLHK